jgi:hypothetical protein
MLERSDFQLTEETLSDLADQPCLSSNDMQRLDSTEFDDNTAIAADEPTSTPEEDAVSLEYVSQKIEEVSNDINQLDDLSTGISSEVQQLRDSLTKHLGVSSSLFITIHLQNAMHNLVANSTQQTLKEQCQEFETLRGTVMRAIFAPVKRNERNIRCRKYIPSSRHPDYEKKNEHVVAHLQNLKLLEEDKQRQTQFKEALSHERDRLLSKSCPTLTTLSETKTAPTSASAPNLGQPRRR